MTQSDMRERVLLLSCPDRKGIVFTVFALLHEAGCNIVDSQQFSSEDDEATPAFFMRIHFLVPLRFAADDALERLFERTRHDYRMTLHFSDPARKLRALVLVSKEAHCLNDLLFRGARAQLPVEFVGVVSNHSDCETLARNYDVPFHLLPLEAGASPAARRAQEQQIEALVRDAGADLVVLARYMQILSPALSEALAGRAINIHHSFLPSFKGARPYRQAHNHGVKLIGATAHYVTPALDEGPIIEQDVERVDHRHTLADLVAIGRDVESVVLARAVKWHCEHRVLTHGQRTVVFR